MRMVVGRHINNKMENMDYIKEALTRIETKVDDLSDKTVKNSIKIAEITVSLRNHETNSSNHHSEESKQNNENREEIKQVKVEVAQLKQEQTKISTKVAIYLSIMCFIVTILSNYLFTNILS